MNEAKIYKVHSGDEPYVVTAVAAGLVGSLVYAGVTKFEGGPFGLISQQNDAYNHYLDSSSQLTSDLQSLRYTQSQPGLSNNQNIKNAITSTQTRLTTLNEQRPVDHTGAVIGETLAVIPAATIALAALAQGICYTGRKLGYRAGGLYSYWRLRPKSLNPKT